MKTFKYVLALFLALFMLLLMKQGKAQGPSAPIGIHRSAETGKYVAAKEAKLSPASTYKEDKKTKLFYSTSYAAFLTEKKVKFHIKGNKIVFARYMKDEQLFQLGMAYQKWKSK